MSNWSKRASVSASLLAIAGAAFLGGHAKADQVIPDDLIVQGSLCVGFDCVNNESFGFDTIRLKENNTRINFMDTSVGSFPTEDWQLVANQSNSGGQSYFAIRDCGASSSGVSECGTRRFTVQAGTVADAIFVDSTGRVGFRTATPVLDLHVRTGNTPAHRLEQDSSSGFTAQTWDIAGNEANFFIRDVTSGSRLPFRIRPGAPTSSIDIAANGNVGIGTASPAAGLMVANGRVMVTGTAAATSGSGVEIGSSGGTEGVLVSVNRGTGVFQTLRMNGLAHVWESSNTEVMRLTAGGFLGVGANNPAAQLHTTGSVRFAGVANCGSGIQSDAEGDLSCITSSRHFKNVAGPLAAETALANVMALRPHVGSYKKTPHMPEHWLIAEEVAEVDPSLVGLRDGKPYVVKTQNVVADLVAVIQQQQRRIEALERGGGGR